MKKQLILSAALVGIAASASAQTVLHYWDFESMTDVVGGLATTGAGMPDLSLHMTYGEAYPGSNQSLNSVLATTGMFGGRLVVDVHDGVAATAMNFGTSDWSVSYWSYNANDFDGRGPRIFDSLESTTNGIQLGTNLAGEYNLRIDDDAGNAAISPPPVFSQALDTWIHVVVNVDRTNGMADIYFDNVLQGSLAIGAVTGTVEPSQDMFIGVINQGNGPAGSQQAGLDDLAFYDGLLSAGDRAALAAGTITPLAFGGAGNDFCNGDGGDQMGCSDCPCGNNAPMGTAGGCTNSAGTSTRLIASGDTSLSLPSGSTTDLQFEVEGSPPSATNVLLSGNAVAPQGMANPCFGLNSGIQSVDRDGLRCIVQVVQRHGNRAANAMGEIKDASGPNRVWGGPAQPTAGIGAQGGFVAGQTRYFQITHRDVDGAVCPPGTGLNTSQAVGVTFTP